jgi:hypothetical protein
MSFFKWFYILLAAGGIAAPGGGGGGGGFTDWTEVDTGGVLTVESTSVTATSMPHGVDAYLYDDISSSPITTSLTIQFEFTHNGYTSSSNSVILGISEGEGGYDTYAAGNNIGLLFYFTGNSIFTGFAETNGVLRGTGTPLAVLGTKYYVTIVYTKAGGAFSTGECITTWRTGSHEGSISIGPQTALTIDADFKNHSFTRVQLGGPSLTGTGNEVSWTLENLVITET